MLYVENEKIALYKFVDVSFDGIMLNNLEIFFLSGTNSENTNISERQVNILINGLR